MPLKPINPENWLTNGEIFSREVWLAKSADSNEWKEVTSEEREMILDIEKL